MKSEGIIMTFEEAEKYYQEHFPEEATFADIADEINNLKDMEGIEHIRKIFCDNLLFCISYGFTKYDEKYFEKNTLIGIYKAQIKKLPDEYSLLWAVYYYFSYDFKKSLLYLKKAMEAFEGKVINEIAIIEWFWEPFKQGFDGFWNEIYKEIKKYEVEDGILEYCQLIGEYYESKVDEEFSYKLSVFSNRYPEYLSARELLGSIYQNMSMWRNSIACLETIEIPMLFFEEDIYFDMAWAYGKCKERRKEEEYYRKCLEINSDCVNALNNLAYSLYLQKRYHEAKELLEKCLEEKRDLPYSANNYIRVLIALGRNNDAKQFLKNTEHKIYKDLRERVKKLDNKNARFKKADCIEEIPEDEAVSTNIDKEKCAKKQQFSNEKILEDELTARLEAGFPVFGMNLKIYRRYGIYGRQFIIPVGRLDLLCEDDKGNLYIIELKKDSGYDDVYVQTAAYLDWFEKNEISKDKKVYGIICLNSPTEKLIKKIRADNRMKLFEYQIIYREIM